MKRIARSLVWALGLIGLGALGYALVRAERRDGWGELLPGHGAGPRGSDAEAGRGHAGAAEPRAANEGAPRCAGVTQSGKRCSREAEAGSSYCWQHGG